MNESTQKDFSTDLLPSERRWAWSEIDRDAIRANLKTLRKRLAANTMMLGVVKADGYGHGATEVAKIALSTGCTYLGVSNVAEGVSLRNDGIEAPIIIFAEPPVTCIDAILSYDLIPAVNTREFALALAKTAAAAGVIAPFHLKVDTGMNRVGVHYTEAGDFLQTISSFEGLKLQGTFTHFATSDAEDTFGFNTQLQRFERVLENIHMRGMDPGIVHSANSAAAIRYRRSHFNMVRLGIAMYGLHPSSVTYDVVHLEPAMSIHARVNMLKQVPLGEGVSYSFTYRSPGGVEVATIPVGYADGLSRLLSNKMDVLVHGQRYPQVGNICMDLCMFEANVQPGSFPARSAQLAAESKPVAYGDEVIIVGKSGNKEITLDEMAALVGTINYELACKFSRRLERVYLN